MNKSFLRPATILAILLGLACLPAAAQTGVLYVTGGDVGIDTSSPQAKFHVENSSGNDSDDVAVTATGELGVGIIPGPIFPLDLAKNNAQLSLRDTVAPGIVHWSLGARPDTKFGIVKNSPGTPILAMSLDLSGNMVIPGTITTGGGTCGGGCDLVFSADYDLPTLEEHAAEMWQKGHLPAVGPTPENQPFDLSDKTGRMLNELEKAHIYIEQLHKRLERLEALVAAQ